MKSLGTFKRYLPEAQGDEGPVPMDVLYFKNEHDEDWYEIIDQSAYDTTLVGVRDGVIKTASNEISTLYPGDMEVWVLDTRHREPRDLYGKSLDEVT